MLRVEEVSGRSFHAEVLEMFEDETCARSRGSAGYILTVLSRIFVPPLIRLRTVIIKIFKSAE